MPLSAGDKLGPYEILAPIGQGGMGEVYRARDSKLGRDVAIKILPPAFATDANRMARFEREARVLASLNHPNIAQIYGVEERALVMEMVEGASPQGPLPFQEAWKIAAQIADALEYAHEKGVIHRDLKPANVKVTPEGVVKLLDFGLAKAYSDLPEGSLPGGDISVSPTITLGATVAGTILGTAAYMSPEQARGKTVDKRADIWSWGVVLYELLTGDRLFQGEDGAETLAAVIHKEPDLARVPARARKLLESCLTKDPRQRLRDIGDAKRMLQDEPAPAAPAPAQQRRASWLAWTIAGVCAVSAAAFAILWLRPAPLPPVTRFQVFPPPGAALPFGTPAPSPDDRMLAYIVRDRDNVIRMYLRSLDSTESHALPGTENTGHPLWSADSRSLAVATPQALKRVDLAGGSARTLASIHAPFQGAWGPGGTLLLGDDGGLSQTSSEGGALSPVVRPDAKRGETLVGFPYFLPDGKRFLAIVERDAGSIELVSPPSAERKPVLSGVNSAPILASTPNGKAYLLFLRDASLMAQEFDPTAGALRGAAFLLVDNIARIAAGGLLPAVGVSPNVLAYQTGGGSTELFRLTWHDRSGKVLKEFSPEVVAGEGLQLSPDARFAVVRRGVGETPDIWIADLARESSTRFTFGGSSKYYGYPVWSPDGKRLAYATYGGGIYVRDADGTGAEQELLRVNGVPQSWSSDGRQLLYWTSRLFVLDIAAKTSTPVGPQTGTEVSGAAISPDGKYFAFASNESGRDEVYVQAMPPGTGKWQISVNGGVQPRWRRDGKEIYFLAQDLKMMAADIQSGQALSAGLPHVLFQSDASGVTRTYDVSADGQKFLIVSARSDAADAPITVVLNWWAALKQ